MTIIVYIGEDNRAVVVNPYISCGLTVEQIAEKDVPAGKEYWILEEPAPKDVMFIDAWVWTGEKITVDTERAKAKAHYVRRIARTLEFTPLDLKTTIPNEATLAEVARQGVRRKYEVMQNSIDAAPDVDALTLIMTGVEW